MSEHAFGSEWAQLEANTFRFRDPLNKERRFIPLRLDGTPIKPSLAQFLYIDWRGEAREQAYAKLLEACRPLTHGETAGNKYLKRVLALNGLVLSELGKFAFSDDLKLALAAPEGKDSIQLWNLETGICLHELHIQNEVYSVAFADNEQYAISGEFDGAVRLWNLDTERCTRVFQGHTAPVASVSWIPGQRRIVSGSYDQTMRLWDADDGRCLRVFEGHSTDIEKIALSSDYRWALSASDDGSIRHWDLKDGRCLRVLQGPDYIAWDVVWSADDRRALTAVWDHTLRLWDIETGRTLSVFEGHTDYINQAIFISNEFALSCADDNTMRLWEVETGRCTRIFEHDAGVLSIAWKPDQRLAFSAAQNGNIQVWDLSELVAETTLRSDPSQQHSSKSNTPTPRFCSSAIVALAKQGFQKYWREESGKPATRQ